MVKPRFTELRWGLVTRHSGNRLLFCLALMFIGSMCAGCRAPAPSAEFVQQAQRLHDGVFVYAVAGDQDLHDYVQLLGKRLSDAAHEVDPNRTQDNLFSIMEYHTVVCPVPNVITTGGSHIYVFSGLIKACQNEDELAAGIAHAFAHAINLDLEHIDLRPDASRPLPLVGWDLATHRYTDAMEQAADRLAFEIYLKAGYDPRRFTGLFEHLADLYPRVQAPDRAPLRIRIQNVRTWGSPVAGTPNRIFPIADPITFESLRQKAEAINAEVIPPLTRAVLLAIPNCLLAGDTPDQEAARQQLKPVEPVKRLEPS
jgi:predicted Zn-dependent protease